MFAKLFKSENGKRFTTILVQHSDPLNNLHTTLAKFDVSAKVCGSLDWSPCIIED